MRKCFTLWVAYTVLADVDHSFEFETNVYQFLNKGKTFKKSVLLIVQF